MLFRLCHAACLLGSAVLLGWTLVSGRELFSVWVPAHLRPMQPVLWKVRADAKPQLANGDRILAVNGRALERPEEWYDVFQNTPIERPVNVTLLRGTSQRTASITVGSDPGAFTPILATILTALFHLFLYRAESWRDLMWIGVGLGLVTTLPDLDHRPIAALPAIFTIGRIAYPWCCVLAILPGSMAWHRVGLGASLLLALGAMPVLLVGYGALPVAWASTADEAFRWCWAFAHGLFWLASLISRSQERQRRAVLVTAAS